jgi:DNA-binding MarR family transcriptional regulator
MNQFPEGPFRRPEIDGDFEAETYARNAANEYKRRFPYADAAAIEVILAMGNAYFSFRAAFSRRLAALGMGKAVNRYSALRILYFAEGKRVLAGRLSKELNVTSANMTYMIDGLENDGLVRRVASENDRRSTFVELTPDGESLCADILPDVVTFLNSVCETLDDGEKATLAGLLARVQRHIESMFPAN